MAKKNPAQQTRKRALAKHLECKVSELKALSYDETAFRVGRAEYLVLTDDEADAKASESILASVWAFNSSYLVEHFPRGLSTVDIDRLRGDRCEQINEAFLALIADKDHFVSDAIGADGRGHFLAGYDCEENDVVIGATRFYIYRVN